MITHPILTELANSGIRLGLESLHSFLTHHDVDVSSFPFVVHVAGTNGKGSVCRFVESVYSAAGYRVGLYTSPHLQHVNERIRIDGASISDAQIDANIQQIQQDAMEWAKEMGFPGTDPLTYFEMMTAVAFRVFADEGVDVVILEVGLGGRLDATNIVRSDVTAIVSVDLDHTDVLGDTIAAIATEKAGIVKPNTTVVIGDVPSEAMRSIRLVAEEKGAPMLRLGEDFSYQVNQGRLIWKYGATVYDSLHIGLLGDHQFHNASVAIGIIEQGQSHRPVAAHHIEQGLMNTRHPGRLEWVHPRLLLDAAHNLAGARRLASYLQGYVRQNPDRELTLLLGASNDKDLRSIGMELAPHVHRIFATECTHPRAMASSLVAQMVRTDTPIFDMGTVENALMHCRPDDVIVVAGSIFLVGAVRDVWKDVMVSTQTSSEI
jgi:dihydrofolate synthase/folylpolyglutamate synthase